MTTELAQPALATPPGEAPVHTPTAALRRLLEGNRRFVRGRSRHPHQSPRDIRELAEVHAGELAVVGARYDLDQGRVTLLG